MAQWRKQYFQEFGLAKSHAHVTMRMMGTFGYMVPEYAPSGEMTEVSNEKGNRRLPTDDDLLTQIKLLRGKAVSAML